jgi:hypothetical protein
MGKVYKTLTDTYELYSEEGGTLTYKEFCDCCCEFNIMAMERILEGEVLYMGHNLSTLRVIRVETNFHKPKINWADSFKRRDELIDQGKELYSKSNPDGEKWFVYYLEDTYCRFYWTKSWCAVLNKSAYRFHPSRGASGNKEKLIKLLQEDETAFMRFPNVRRIGDVKDDGKGNVRRGVPESIKMKLDGKL